MCLDGASSDKKFKLGSDSRPASVSQPDGLEINCNCGDDGFERSNRLFVTIKVQDSFDVSALLDSGSESTLFPASMIDKFIDCGILVDKSPILCGVADGSTAVAVGSAMVKLSLGPDNCTLKVVFMKNLPAECIIGMDGIRLLIASINPQKNTVETVSKFVPPVIVAPVEIKDGIFLGVDPDDHPDRLDADAEEADLNDHTDVSDSIPIFQVSDNRYVSKQEKSRVQYIP